MFPHFPLLSGNFWGQLLPTKMQNVVFCFVSFFSFLQYLSKTLLFAFCAPYFCAYPHTTKACVIRPGKGAM